MISNLKHCDHEKSFWLAFKLLVNFLIFTKVLILRKIYWFLKLLAISLCLASMNSCQTQSASPSVNSSQVSPEESVTNVSVSIVERNIFEYSIEANGKIKSLNEQYFSAESGSKVVVCNAKAGKIVTTGNIILILDTNSIQQRLNRSLLTRFNCQKEYESQLLGYENLLKDKSKEQADEIRQKLRISTGFAAAELDIREAKYDLSKAIIKSPFNGVLSDINVQQGQQLKSGDPLFRIYDPKNLLLEVKVLETDISKIKQGTLAEISPIFNQEHIYHATVHEINPYVDENGMVTIKLKIKNVGSDDLFPGMNCNATIRVAFNKVIIIPKEAVVMRNSRAVVFTAEEGKAKWNYVITGRENEKEIEVKEGLKEGEKVIISNNLLLAHEAPIKVVANTKKD